MADGVVVAENYTIHGKKAIIHRDFAYIFDTDLALSKKRWKSINYSTCKAYLWVFGASVMKVGGIHMHKVEPERIEARLCVTAFKTDVFSQRHANLDGLTAIARDCEVAVQNAMPSTSSLKRAGARQGNRQESARVHFERHQFELEDGNIKVHGPAGDLSVNFILHDDGPDHLERIIMFGTTASIGLLTTTQRIQVAVPPTALNYNTRRSSELKVLCLNYQNGNYATAPIRTGLIRFLSEIAAVLICRPPGDGV